MGLPDLVLLDLRMPAMAVVVRTAGTGSRKRADEIDADATLEKPFELAELHATLARLLCTDCRSARLGQPRTDTFRG